MCGQIKQWIIDGHAAGIGTYLDLLESPPPALRTRLERLPLQSPGVAAYLAVKPAPTQ